MYNCYPSSVSPDEIRRVLPDPVALVHRDGTFLEIDSHGTLSLPICDYAFVGESVFAHATAPDHEPLRQAMEHVLTTGEMVQTEFAVVREANRQHYEARLLPAGDDTVYMVLRDLTRQREAERNLHYLLANIPCLIWHGTIRKNPDPDAIHSYDWQLQHSSEVSRKNFVPLDVPQGSAYSSVWMTRVSDEEWQQRHENAHTALSQEHPSYTSVFRCLDRYGVTHFIREEVHLEKIGHETWRGVGLFTNITELKETEERLRDSEKRLELLNRLGSIRTDTTVEAAVTNIVRETAAHFAGLRVTYATRDEEGVFTVVSSEPAGDEPAPIGQRFDLSHAPEYLAKLRRCEMLVANNVGQEPLFAPFLKTMGEMSAGAILAMPISLQEEVAGVLYLQDTTAREWQESEKQTLSEVARVLSVALLEVLLQEARRRVERENQERLVLLQAAHAKLQQQQQELAALNAKLEALATTDALTGLKNRRVFEEHVEIEYQRAQRSGRPLSILLLDTDRFKQYNDSFGHLGGDSVLRLLAEMLVEETRPIDLVARYGGEEFAIILPGVGAEGSLAVAERIRGRIAGANWRGRAVTVSIGAATVTPDIADWPELVHLVDQMLYRSKSLGRNRVTHATF